MNTTYARRFFVLGLCLANATYAFGQTRVETNVVYGMYSGTALLLDIHHPAQTNGFGVIFIAGSGWNARLGYSAAPLKESEQVGMYVPSLVAAGYTVFAVTHRATPTFRYPAPVEDVQRAVRFVRANAAKYGIDSTRIGGVGGSSGAHLLSLMGTLDGAGDKGDLDPVNRESAKLQAVAARAAPLDLTEMRPSDVADALAMFIGARVSESTPKTSVEYKTAWSASPLAHVSADDAPFLLLHGDADESVPFGQSERMEAALKGVDVPVKLVRIAGAGHGPDFPGAKNPPDYKGEIVRWLNTYLRKVSSRVGSR
jgi:acetyl esterase/lipase